MPELCEKYPEDFEKVTLCLHKDVIKSLRSASNVRGLAGNAFGILDAFMIKLLEQYDAGERVIEFIKKSDKEKYEI